MKKINEIIDILINKGLIINDGLEVKRLKSGTTNGVLYTLLYNEIPTYVMKIDTPEIITATKDFLVAYNDIGLLPDVLYTDDEKEFIAYSYISGETHFNRGSKIEWMTLLIKELFNEYKKVDKDTPWGRIDGIHRNSWSEFNQSSLESARRNIGDLLPSEDHKRIEILVNKLKSYHDQEEKYYLHGDTGVHNFVYLDTKLKGVIDPSPLIGPKIYDFTYSFCSSPDSLNLSTLFSLFPLWDNDSINKERLLDEVLFQLYTRIGVCIKVHPHDLNDYMEAWKEWRKYLHSN
ncbi:phosphotransferase [Viridibacillus sp. NPDC093762]|uniref:phosphotransferase n=1 Tax=Viridibacillus sp. NPDC093762 TaxID=3390720 RepID=UPI003CFC4780